MGEFSGKILLGDLNDFINPSVACTNPIFTEETSTSGSKISLSFDLDESFPTDVKPDIIKTTVKKVATVSLNDCLACSGCVTSAETVLIQQHNTEEFIHLLQNKNDKIVVVCLSQQSIANIADFYHLSICDCYEKVYTILKENDVDYIIDSSMGDELAQIEIIHEFNQRKSMEQPSRLPWKKEDPSIAINKEITIFPPSSIPISSLSNLSLDKDKNILEDFKEKGYLHLFKDYQSYSYLPLIASSCPAIICYGEKTYPELIPYLSYVKSPQQILATYIYDYLYSLYHKSVYITSVMSCYDKKLEANRGDFKHINGERELNYVLTSSELIDVFNKFNIQMETIVPSVHLNEFEEMFAHNYKTFSKDLNIPEQLTESGNYLNSLLNYIYIHSTIPLTVQWKAGKNSDFNEVSLVDSNNNCVFKGCYVYGYRNLQNIIIKIKRGVCTYNFIELMACPKGCINGGGQIKVNDDINYDNMHTLFSSISSLYSINSQSSNTLYDSIKQFYHHTENSIPEFHTRYHTIVTSEHNSLNW